MSKRIDTVFARAKQEKRPASVAYVTMGCPSLAESGKLAAELLDAGADILEIGVPFSDPMADGPVIQHASQIALRNGTTLKGVLGECEKLRAAYPDVPLVLFSYYNVLLQFGPEALAAELERIGVDGCLVVDLPLEEREEFTVFLDRHGIDFIPLLTLATPPERRRRIAAGCRAFAYFVTVLGVTGVRREFPEELAARLDEARRELSIPVAAGFGISSAAMAAAAGKYADAVVTGSALVRHAVEGDIAGAVAEFRSIFPKK